MWKIDILPLRYVYKLRRSLQRKILLASLGKLRSSLHVKKLRSGEGGGKNIQSCGRKAANVYSYKARLHVAGEPAVLHPSPPREQFFIHIGI